MHANIFKSLFYMQCKSFNFAPLGLIAYIWKRVILAFISFFWLQRSLVFVSNIYAIYLFISLSHCTEAGVVSVVMLSSLAALEVVISTTYGAASDESTLRVATFPFQWASIHWNRNVVILMKFSSLIALEVVKTTASNAVSDENFFKMTTFSFQCR